MASPADTARARWIALVVLCTGMLMIILDSTIVNVALPSIQTDLGFSQSDLAWVVNAYLIAFGGLLLLAGRLGDLIGRRRVFMAGLALFTAASLACGIAQSEAWLIIARFVPGIGGAAAPAGVPRDVRDHVPGEGGAGAGDRCLQLRRGRWRFDRTAGRRRSDAGAQLALDLLREHPDRNRDRRAGNPVRGPRRRDRPRTWRRPARCGADHRRPHAGRLHDPRGR